MVLFLGILLIIISLLVFAWSAKNSQMSPLSRPMIFSSKIFIIFCFISVVLLLLGGFFLIFKSSFTVGLIFLAVIALIFLLLRRGSSIDATKKSMYKSYERLKTSCMGSSINEMGDIEKIEHEKNILFHTLEPRYRYIGKYSTETLLSIVNEYPTIESLTNFVILFEFFEEKYPSMNVEELREQVRATLDTLKKTDSDIYSGIKDYIEGYQEFLISGRFLK